MKLVIRQNQVELREGLARGRSRGPSTQALSRTAVTNLPDLRDRQWPEDHRSATAALEHPLVNFFAGLITL